MSDVEHEHLPVPPAHSVFSQHTASGSYTGTTTITGASAAPPFAPHPHYAQHQQHQQRTHSGSGGTAPSSRSGGTSAHTDPPAVSTTECNIHEVCYYFQQAIFILAIMTGVALVIAGTVMHVQNGELLVFVYIGVLLAGVNTVLLMIQCCVRRKQKRRSRAYQATRQTHVATQSSAVHYNPLTPNVATAVPQTIVTVPHGSDVQQYHYKHYHLHSPTVAQPMFQDFPVQQGLFAQSPTESQSRFLHAAPYHRSGSVVSHHRHAKGIYQKSPPLGQSHRPLLTPAGSQLPTPRSEVGPQESFSPSAPPPSYDDLVRTGRLPQEGTTVHLI